MRFAYPYIGPKQILEAAKDSPKGAVIRSQIDLRSWLKLNPSGLSEGATFVVDLAGQLKLAPRRSEHVACAGCEDVLAAGEICFAHENGLFKVAEVSNQSTGYCPDIDSWNSVHKALSFEGLTVPEGYTRPIVFRRCLKCQEVNLVKENWFVCVFCDAELPAQWNISARRELP